MPVVVTGADSRIGGALVRRLVGTAAEVRAYVPDRPVAEGLRSLGVKAAVGEVDDRSTLRLVLDGAHTVVHLAGGWRHPHPAAYEAANLASTGHVLRASRKAGVRRVLLLSAPGADPAADHPYLRAKGLAEEEVRASELEYAIVRVGLAYGPGSRWLEAVAAGARAPIATAVGDGSQRVAPVHLSDVAEVLAAADDRAGEVHGTYALEGPDVVTMDELVELLAGRRRRIVHLSPRRAARLPGSPFRGWPELVLDLLARGGLADAPDAAREFGIGPLTGLADGLRGADGGAVGHPADPSAPV